MPVFNLELKFNEDGATKAVINIENIINVAKDATKEIDNTGKSASNVGNDIVASMKKAAAAVLGVVSAWKALNMAQRVFTLGSGYNERIEKAQLGIASVVAATNELEDAQGRLLQGQEKFNAAQEISVKMAKALDVASMQSPAEYNDLLSTFQTLLAPATQLGLKWQDTLDITIRMSNVLSSLGLDMKSLANETQAILTGKDISRSNVASRLGLTQSEIESWGKGEQLLANLEKRLESFKYSGQAVENTMEAVRAYFEDVIANLAGDAVTGLWDQVKTGLTEVADAFYEIDEKTKEFKITDEMKGLIEVSQEISNAIGKEFVSAIRSGLDALRSLGTSISEMGVSQFLSEIKTYSGVALAGITALKIARKAASSQWAVEVAGTKDGIAAIYKHTATVIKDTQAKHQNALASRAEIQAEIQSLQIKLKLTQSLLQNARNTKVLTAAKEKQIAIINQLTAAETRLAAADKLVNRTTIAMTTLSKVGSSLLSLFGGPLGLALTGIGLGVGYLATKQSNAEKAANLHADALRNFTNAAENAKNAGKNLSDQLDALGENQKARAIEDAKKSIEESKKSVDKSGSFYKMARPEVLDYGVRESQLGKIDQQLLSTARNLDNLKQQVNQGKLSLSEYKKALDNAYVSLSKNELGQTDLANAIRAQSDAVEAGAASEQLLKGNIEGVAEVSEQSKSEINANATALNGLVEAIDLLINATKGQVSSEKEALEYLEKRYESTKAGKEALEENARAKDENALKTLQLGITELEAAYNAAQAIAIMEGATAAQIESAKKLGERLDFLKSRYAEFIKHKDEFKLPGSRQGGGTRKSPSGSSRGGAKDAENAAKKWKEFEEQLAVLEGRATSSAQSLKKTLDNIEETGKAAKKSADEIDKMQKSFIAASDKKSLQELNKELAQLAGNTRKVQEIERQEKTDQLRAKINDIKSLSKEDRDILLNRAETLVQQEFKVKDLQTSVDFLKELGSLGGEYGASIEMQNQLIEYQATLYRDTLPSSMQGYIAEWERLKLLENDTSFMGGLKRGVKKFGSDYANVAKTVEDLTTQMGSHISNTLSDAFMKGKFSAQDFFNSIVSMAAQAASNQFIGMIFKGLGSVATYSAGQTATMSANGMQSGFGGWLTGVHGHAHGNVFSGGDIGTFSNKIVSGPTLFSYDSHWKKFAKGGGVMGESGAEAVMPLTRASGGDLGVKAVFDDGWKRDYSADFTNLVAQMRDIFIESRQSYNEMPNLSVNIINNASNADVQTTNMQPDGNGGFSMDVIISQVEQGIVGRMKQGKSQIAQYQEKAYGMNRAPVLARGRGRA